MPAALSLALAAALALGAYAGEVVLLLAVLVVQGLLVRSWHGSLAVPGARGGMILAGSTALAADVVLLLRDDARPLTPVTGVLGLAMMGALVHQLCRRPHRDRLTASLTATTMLVALVAFAALFLAAAQTRGDASLVALTGVAAAAAAAAGLLALPPLLLVVLATAGGTATGAAMAGLTELTQGTALLVGAASAATAAAATAFVRRAERPDLATAGALPLAVVAPLGYVLGRILVG